MGDRTHVDAKWNPINSISDSPFMRIFSMLQGLENLNLAGNNITDAGMKVSTDFDHKYYMRTILIRKLLTLFYVAVSNRTFLKYNAVCAVFCSWTYLPMILVAEFLSTTLLRNLMNLNALMTRRRYWDFDATIGGHILCLFTRARYFL